MDLGRIQKAVEEILHAIGEDTTREGLRRTPERVARAWAELCSGTGTDPAQVISTTFEQDHEQVVVVRDIFFVSLCEHHLLPFYGRAHIAYIPKGRVAGASKLVRAVDVVSRRLQMQERMTGQLADALMRALNPDGVAVAVEAEHLCMVARGVRRPGSLVVTSAVKGPFASGTFSPRDLLSLILRR